mmetsp:Transcript_42685/g.107745  ORF Transcript_42685/g.107745 Transcript_42685/m.107745 type:complete len:434 (-) Transcript_42685:98-1399(-)
MSRKNPSVFVGNIPYNATEEQLIEIFSEVGKVLTFRLLTDPSSGRPRGYGFCEYADRETALSAIRNLNGREISGRSLRVSSPDEDSHATALTGLEQTTGFTNAHQPMVADPVGAIRMAVEQMPRERVLALLHSAKDLMKDHPSEARDLLAKNPQLSVALLHAQVRLGTITHEQARVVMRGQTDLSAPAPVPAPPATALAAAATGMPMIPQSTGSAGSVAPPHRQEPIRAHAQPMQPPVMGRTRPQPRGELLHGAPPAHQAQQQRGGPLPPAGYQGPPGGVLHRQQQKPPFGQPPHSQHMPHLRHQPSPQQQQQQQQQQQHHTQQAQQQGNTHRPPPSARMGMHVQPPLPLPHQGGIAGGTSGASGPLHHQQQQQHHPPPHRQQLAAQPGAGDPAQKQLLEHILRLSPEEVALLPPAQQEQVKMLREQARARGL